LKPLNPVLIVGCFCIIYSLFSGVGSALEQDEATVMVMGLSGTLYPGDDVNVTVVLLSSYSEELEIYQLGLHFDWMTSNIYSILNMSDNPVTIPSNGTYAFPVTVSIPEDVDVGTHSYFVRIGGLHQDFTYFDWKDPYNRTLSIQDSEEETYNEVVDVNSQQDQLSIIIGVVVVAVVAVLIIILVGVRKKRRKTA
jgi:hypothetical protein